MSKTSSFNSPNSKFLEIFGFIRIDFMCFSNKGFLEIYSVFPKEKWVFFFADNSLQKYYDIYHDILQPVDHFLKQCCFIKLFFTVFSMFNVKGFLKSTEFEFQFALRIPVVS